MPAPHFEKGDKVEVTKGDSNSTSWFPASIIRPFPSKHKGQIYVEYETHSSADEDESEAKRRRREYVFAANVRPLPPVELHRYFKVGENVDAFHDKAWRRGTIVHTLDESRYAVSFEGVVEPLEFDQWNLRLHRDWDDGSWVPAFHRQKFRIKFSGTKSDAKFSGTKSDAKFKEGTMVEVKSDEEGFHGSWFTAVIVGSLGEDKFLIEYQTLKSEDETQPLKEMAEASLLRPCPPNIQRVDRFKLFEKVDTWYNDGWWVGLVSGVLDGLKYAVYFWTTNEELEFGHFSLRPHQEWIRGKWVAEFPKNASFLSPKPRPGKLKGQNGLITSGAKYFCKGMKVEVKSDDEGFSGCWYPAVIIQSLGTGKYLVEYSTLKSDDENKLLKEEADALCIRPCFPVIQRKDPFGPFDEVDAWYNAAWWVGGVCKVLQGSMYEVYIRGMNEALEFQHSDLRPHQDWTDGKWLIPCRGRKL